MQVICQAILSLLRTTSFILQPNLVQKLQCVAIFLTVTYAEYYVVAHYVIIVYLLFLLSAK